MEGIRNKGLDLLRIISAAAVVLLHCNALFFLTNMEPHTSVVWQIESAINLLTRFSVPCFVMISGAFLLSDDRNENGRYFYRKSFKKILLPYLCIAFFWIGMDAFRLSCGKTDIFLFLRGILRSNYGNLWFMPMLLGLYLLTPLLIKIRKALNSQQALLAFAIWMVWAILSQSATKYTIPYSLGVVVSYMAYFWGGYVIKKLPAMPGRLRLGGGYCLHRLDNGFTGLAWFRI